MEDEININICVFGESGFGKTTLIKAFEKVIENRFYDAFNFSFHELHGPEDADVFAQADAAVFVCDATDILSEASDDLLSIAVDLNIPRIDLFVNKEDLAEVESLELAEMEASQKLVEYGFSDSLIVPGSALKALEDPLGEWGDKIEYYLTNVKNEVKF